MRLVKFSSCLTLLIFFSAPNTSGGIAKQETSQTLESEKLQPQAGMSNLIGGKKWSLKQKLALFFGCVGGAAGVVVTGILINKAIKKRRLKGYGKHEN